MTIIEINISDLREYENNPRHNEAAVKAVAASIDNFGFKVPIIIDRNNVIVAGHTRRKAAELLGLEKVPCIVADDLTPEQVKAFRLADNKTAELAEWDFEKLESELAELDFDMSQFGFEDLFQENEDEINPYDIPQDEKGSLTEKFIIPPFSIIDTRSQRWQDRKRAWLKLGLKSEVGRSDTLLSKGLKQLGEAATYSSETAGVSVFDPALCEIMYKWFNVYNGSIFDCFAGGSVRGIVAEKLGYNYTGIDLRQEQIDANNKNAQELGVSPTWYCDDSKNADKYIEDESVDMIFSCPPYADLEVYSDDPRDISNMDYEDFCAAYKEIITIACRKLKQDRFAVFVVGDIRDKKGFYRNFIDYTKKCFNESDLLTYNELILVNVVGTASLRATKYMDNRKVAKTHQNVLVFYKGDPKNIKANYGEIQIDEEFLNSFITEE